MALAALCLLLCGCCDYRELDRRDIVSGMAVDRGREGYGLLLEVADVTAGSDDNPQARWLKLRGESLAGAVGSDAGSSGRQAYLGHAQLVVVGDKTAREGLDDLLWYLRRTADVHMTLTPAVAEGEAAALLRRQEGEKIAAFDLARAAVQAGQSGLAPAMPLYRFIGDRHEEGIEGILPRIARTGDGLAVAGAALFRGDKLAGRLDIPATQALLMARGLLREGVLTVGAGGQSVAFAVRDCRVRLRTGEKNGALHAQYDIALELELSQGGDLSTETRERYEQLARRAVEERFERLFDLLQRVYGVDALGVGRHIHRSDRTLWKRVGENWPENFKSCPIAVRADVVLLGSGRTLR